MGYSAPKYTYLMGNLKALEYTTFSDVFALALRSPEAINVVSSVAMDLSPLLSFRTATCLSPTLWSIATANNFRMA